MLGIPNRMTDMCAVETTVRGYDGVIRSRKLKFFDCDFTEDISLLFPKFDTAFRYFKAINDGFIGDAPCQLCDCGLVFEAVKTIFENSGNVDPLKIKDPIPPSRKCLAKWVNR